MRRRPSRIYEHGLHLRDVALARRDPHDASGTRLLVLGLKPWMQVGDALQRIEREPGPARTILAIEWGTGFSRLVVDAAIPSTYQGAPIDEYSATPLCVVRDGQVLREPS